MNAKKAKSLRKLAYNAILGDNNEAIRLIESGTNKQVRRSIDLAERKLNKKNRHPVNSDVAPVIQDA